MSEKQILDKLASIEKEQKISSALTHASIGFAVSAFVAASAATATTTLMRVIYVTICTIGLCWLGWNVAKWRLLSKPEP